MRPGIDPRLRQTSEKLLRSWHRGLPFIRLLAPSDEPIFCIVFLNLGEGAIAVPVEILELFADFRNGSRT